MIIERLKNGFLQVTYTEPEFAVMAYDWLSINTLALPKHDRRMPYRRMASDVIKGLLYNEGRGKSR